MDVAENLKRQGKQIISLNVGEPDFPVPEKIKNAIVEALDKNLTKYTSIAGIYDLRKAICDKLERDNGLKYSPEQIVVSTGAKQTLLQTVMALVCPGDQVVIPSPYWTSYSDMVTLSGGQTIELPCSVKEGFKLTSDALRNCLSKLSRPKVLMLNYPSNPTGVVYSREELLKIAKGLTNCIMCIF
jgi:aspartate aminotransferase